MIDISNISNRSYSCFLETVLNIKSSKGEKNHEVVEFDPRRCKTNWFLAVNGWNYFKVYIYLSFKVKYV